MLQLDGQKNTCLCYAPKERTFGLEAVYLSFSFM